MQNADEDFIANLALPSAAKQVETLTRLIQVAVRGRPVRGFFRAVMEHCMRSDNHIVRKLALDVIGFSHCTEQEWVEVVAVLQRDIQSEDEQLRVVGLEAIPSLPGVAIIELMKSGADALEACLDVEQGAVRQAACIAVGSVLRDINTLDELGRHSVRDLLVALCAHLTDGEDYVSGAAFSSVSNLLKRWISMKTGYYEHVTAPDQDIWHEYIAFVAFEKIVSRFDEMVTRVSVLPPRFRRPGIMPLCAAVLSVSATDTQMDSSRVSNKFEFVDEHRRSVSASYQPRDRTCRDLASMLDILTNKLIFSLLRVEMDSQLIFEAVMGMLLVSSIPAVTPHQRAQWTLLAHKGMLAVLSREEAFPIAGDVVGRLAGTVHQVSSSQDRLNLAIHIGRQGCKAQNVTERLMAFIPLCDVIVNLAVDEYRERRVNGNRSDAKIRPLSVFWECDWIKKAKDDSTEQIREEITSCLLMAVSKISPEKPDDTNWSAMRSIWITVACDVLEMCSVCLKWRCGIRTYCAETLLKLLCLTAHVVEKRFADRRMSEAEPDIDEGQVPESPGRASISGSRVQRLLVKLLEQYGDISSGTVQTQVVTACCRFLDFSSGSSSAQKRAGYLLKVIKSRCIDAYSGVERTRMIREEYLAGNLPPSELDLPQPLPFQDAEIMSRALMSLGLRCAPLAPQVTSLLDELLKNRDADVSSRDAFLDAGVHIKYAQREEQRGQEENNLMTEIMGSVFDGGEALCGVEGSLGGGANGEFWASHGAAVRTIQHKNTVSVKTSESDGDLFLRELALSTSQPRKSDDFVLLSGSSDPITVRACHTADSVHRLINITVRLTNITPVSLENTTIILSMIGVLDPIDPVSQVSHEFSVLKSEETGEFSVCFMFRSFSKGGVVVSILLEHPDITKKRREEEEEEFGGDDLLEEGQDADSVRSEETPDEPDAPPPIPLTCAPYIIHPSSLVAPAVHSMTSFKQQWASLPARSQLTAVMSKGCTSSEMRDGFERSGCFGLVQGRVICGDTIIQDCYAGHTWFNDMVLLTVTGSLDIPTRQFVLRIEIRASTHDTLVVVEDGASEWLRLISGGVLELAKSSSANVANLFSRTDNELSSFSPFTGIYATPHVSDAILERYRLIRSKR